MSRSDGDVTIVAVQNAKSVGDWLTVPHTIFAGDPAWVPPLNFLEKRRISRKHAPFFSFGEAQLFLAYRGGRPVGRISAQINHRHLDRYRDNAGHFGFFDCQNDLEVAKMLVEAAADWLRTRGMTRMVGPMNFSLNEECGCLVSGFDSSPAILMTHARRWFGSLLEAAGLRKQIDLLAYRLQRGKLPQEITQIAERAFNSPGVSIRQLEMQHYEREVRTLVAIFNDAWSENWGFVPFSEAEIHALLAEMRPLFRSHYGRFVLFNGEPVGLIVGLPNINQVISQFNGRLFPFNWLKLWWALKREAIPTARVPLLGIKKAYQNNPVGGMLLALLISEFMKQMQHHDLQWAEFSWVLESNERVVKVAELACGPPVKTYRIFSKPL